MTTDLNTLLTALYVKIDDGIGGTRWLGRPPLLTDNPKLDEREVLAAMLEVDADLVARREGIVLISDKGFASKAFEQELADLGIELLRPSFKREKKRFGEPMLKKVRQLIESVNDTLKGQLDLEQYGGRTFEGVAIRVAQRVLAMATAIWHNNQTGAPVSRSLIEFDH
ncbi:hypothetical protein [Kitasatospora sp. A2-31]|uniref:hypothetical protein n=1 Tax=Kitasatospora sp. A2-31 TaxID=2916414 RepID=UPI001EE9120C|nr:hypothetical protein [Kitasatospora sp. A2-31]MCG6493267.1 hypothetical protein [Kitasatospora sp. A2-31]